MSDKWPKKQPGLSVEEFHAIGVMVRNWNQVEMTLHQLFYVIADADDAKGWILSHNLSIEELCDRIAALVKLNDHKKRVQPYVKKLKKCIDACRKNRNDIIHSLPGSDHKTKKKVLMKPNTYKPDMPTPKRIEIDLATLRRVADEIEDLHRELIIWTVCFQSPEVYSQPEKQLVVPPLPKILAQ